MKNLIFLILFVSNILYASGGAFIGGGGPSVPISLPNGGWGASVAESTNSSQGTITALSPTTNLVKFIQGQNIDLEGIVAQTVGNRLTLINLNSPVFTIHNQSLGASAANRITLANGNNTLVLPVGSLIQFIYDSNFQWAQQYASTSAVNYPVNTTITSMTGGTGIEVVDVADSILYSNSTNHDPMIDFSGTTQNGRLNFDDTGAGPGIVIFSDIQFGGSYQFQFDTGGNSYIQNDGGGNLNIENSSGSINLNSSGTTTINSAATVTGTFTVSSGSDFSMSGGGSINGANNITASSFGGDGFNITDLNYDNINSPPLSQSGQFNGNLNTNGNYLIVDSGGLTFSSGTRIQDSGGSESILPYERQLYMNNGDTLAMDFTGNFQGASAAMSFDGSGDVQFSQNIYDGNGNERWSPSNGLFTDGSINSLDLNNRYLIASDGSTVVFNWNAQESTTGTTSGFTANTSANPVFLQSTFTGGVGSTGFTLSDIVLALKNKGILVQ